MDIIPQLRAKRSRFLALTKEFSLKKKGKEALRQACAPLLVEKSCGKTEFTALVFGNGTRVHGE